MQAYTHPLSGVQIEGIRLPIGSALREDDRYDSTDGKWRTCNYVSGSKIEPGCTTTWIRQPEPLSESARTLLGYLNQQPWGTNTCIGKHDDQFYVIPSPTFNWDGRFDIQSMRVQHPECVQELVDTGYLAAASYDTTNWQSDYATVWSGHRNYVYVLTEEGRQAHALLLAP